jgi:hypothetical protein
MSFRKADQELKEQLRLLYPGASEDFISTLFHNIRGKQDLFGHPQENDDSISDINYFGMSD